MIIGFLGYGGGVLIFDRFFATQRRQDATLDRRLHDMTESAEPNRLGTPDPPARAAGHGLVTAAIRRATKRVAKTHKQPSSPRSTPWSLNLLFGTILSAFASDRPVAVFPMANRVIVETRADGSVRLRSCTLPRDYAEPPVACTDLGVSLPDTPAANASFDRQLRAVFEELELRALRSEHRWFLMEAAAGASVARDRRLSRDGRIYRRFGRRPTASELKNAL